MNVRIDAGQWIDGNGVFFNAPVYEPNTENCDMNCIVYCY